MTTERHKQKKLSILNAGREVMWKQGYHGTSVKDIVDAAGIPKGSFYFYFDSKEHFTLEALDHYMSEMQDVNAEIIEDLPVAPLVRLRRFFEARIAMADEYALASKGCFLMNIATEMAGQSEKIRDHVCCGVSKMIDPVKKLLEEAIEDGSLKTNHSAEDLALFIENTWRGALAVYKANKSMDIFESTNAIIFDHLLNMEKTNP